MESSVVKFGDYNFNITNFIHPKFKLTYNFPFSLKISPTKLLETKVGKGGKNSKPKKPVKDTKAKEETNSEKDGKKEKIKEKS